MSEENNNAEMSEAESTADKAKKLSADARGLGPRQVGLITIGVVDMIVGNSGVGARLRGHGKTKSYNWCGTGQRKLSIELSHFSCTASRDRPNGALANSPTGA